MANAFGPAKLLGPHAACPLALETARAILRRFLYLFMQLFHDGGSVAYLVSDLKMGEISAYLPSCYH
jgi:hypothetical protein